MRKSGRTSRIIDFAIDQLFSVGEVVVTDHTSFEFLSKTGPDSSMVHEFARRVQEEFRIRSRGKYECSYKTYRLMRGSDLTVVYFIATKQAHFPLPTVPHID